MSFHWFYDILSLPRLNCITPTKYDANVRIGFDIAYNRMVLEVSNKPTVFYITVLMFKSALGYGYSENSPIIYVSDRLKTTVRY